MTISYPIQLPTDPTYADVTFGLVSHTTVFSSNLTRYEQVLERPGAIWAANFRLPPMKDPEKLRPWIAALTSLRGRFGTFLAGDPLGETPRGTPTGTPVVDGAGQTGRKLNTKGWTPSSTGNLMAGDYIELNGRLHMLTLDAPDATGGGQIAGMTIEPPLRESPTNNTPVKTVGCRVRMRLGDDRVTWDIGEAMITGLAFEAVEAL